MLKLVAVMVVLSSVLFVAVLYVLYKLGIGEEDEF